MHWVILAGDVLSLSAGLAVGQCRRAAPLQYD